MTGPGRVVVVGLGPAGTDFLLPAARSALQRAAVRFARTARHPAVAQLGAEGIALEPLDHCYESAADLDAAYFAIVAVLLDAAGTHGEVAYAVPGNPAVAERTPVLLREAGVEVEVVPGLSFAELAWTRLGVDPLGGARLCDGRDFVVSAAGASGPLLVAQCDTRDVLSEVKLALLDALAPDHAVTVLQRLGLAGEAVFAVPLADLDHACTPDHLTAVFVDTGAVAVAPEFARLVALAERLRGPGGCPWDAAQTHHSLRRHLLEEAYEVAAAIEELPFDAPGGDVEPGAYDALCDELGDLLFQVVIHTVLAGEAGAFTIADVSRGIHDKLVRRHPHVFGTVAVDDADEVVANWEQIKREEQGHTSLVEGITPGLPALLYVQKLARKADAIGLEPAADPLADLTRAAARLVVADPAEAEAVVGDVLAAAVLAARARDVDAESALTGWARRFRDRFRAMERLAVERGVDLAAAPAASASLWQEAGAEPG